MQFEMVTKVLWDDDQVERLKFWISETRLSYTRIAKEMEAEFYLPFTGGMIAGKVNRLKISSTRAVSNGKGGCSLEDSSAKPRPSPVKRRRRPPPPPPPPALLLPAPPVNRFKSFNHTGPACDGVALEDLQAGKCRWPLGPVDARPPYLFCGNQSIGKDQPYCAGHSRLAYQQPEPSKRRGWGYYSNRR